MFFLGSKLEARKIILISLIRWHCKSIKSSQLVKNKIKANNTLRTKNGPLLVNIGKSQEAAYGDLCGTFGNLLEPHGTLFVSFSDFFPVKWLVQSNYMTPLTPGIGRDASHNDSVTWPSPVYGHFVLALCCSTPSFPSV